MEEPGALDANIEEAPTAINNNEKKRAIEELPREEFLKGIRSSRNLIPRILTWQ